VVLRLLLVKEMLAAKVVLLSLAEIYLAAAAVELVLLVLTLIPVIMVVTGVMERLRPFQEVLRPTQVAAGALGILMRVAQAVLEEVVQEEAILHHQLVRLVIQTQVAAAAVENKVRLVMQVVAAL
jgi:hypothetical protein